MFAAVFLVSITKAYLVQRQNQRDCCRDHQRARRPARSKKRNGKRHYRHRRRRDQRRNAHHFSIHRLFYFADSSSCIDGRFQRRERDPLRDGRARALLQYDLYRALRQNGDRTDAAVANVACAHCLARFNQRARLEVLKAPLHQRGGVLHIVFALQHDRDQPPVVLRRGAYVAVPGGNGVAGFDAVGAGKVSQKMRVVPHPDIEFVHRTRDVGVFHFNDFVDARLANRSSGDRREVAGGRVVVLVMQPVRVRKMGMGCAELCGAGVHQRDEGGFASRNVFGGCHTAVVGGAHQDRPQQVMRGEFFVGFEVQRTLTCLGCVFAGSDNGIVGHTLAEKQRGHDLGRARHWARRVGGLRVENLPADGIDEYRACGADIGDRYSGFRLMQGRRQHDVRLDGLRRTGGMSGRSYFCWRSRNGRS